MSTKPAFIILALWIVAALTFVGWNAARLENALGPPATGDFRQFWAAGNVLARGGDPYHPKVLSEFLEAHESDAMEPLPFYYPFFSFTALLPFAVLDFSVARICFLGISLILYLRCSLWPSASTLGGSLRRGKLSLSPLLELSVLVTFLPALIFWWDGPMTLFPLAGLACFFLLERKDVRATSKTAFLQGVSVSLLLVKPTVCFLVLAYLSAAWLRRKQWTQLAGLSLGFFSLFVPSVVLFERWHELPLGSPGAPGPLMWNTPTVSTFLRSSLGLSLETVLILPAAAFLFALWRVSRLAPSAPLGADVRRLMVPLSLVTVPYAWTYDFVLLLFPIGSILETSRQSGYFPDPKVAALFGLNLYLAASPLEMELHWWYPLGVLVLCIGSEKPERASSLPTDSPEPHEWTA